MARSFKSVGITTEDLTTQKTSVAAAPLPIGIITPVQLGTDNEGLLAMSYSVGAQMKNNLRDLVMTNWGERVALYDYGANIGPMVTEYENGKDRFDEIVMQRISNAVAKWMPYVELENFDSAQRQYTNYIGLGVVVITIDYSIPRANIPTSRLQITFAVS